MLKLILQSISGKLPTSEYKLFDGKKSVGKIQIRHKLSHSALLPEDFASHIYYEIEASERGKGYGNEILKLGLIEASKLGLNEVIITCEDANERSKKVIKANGGTLIGETTLEDGRRFLKYIIKL